MEIRRLEKQPPLGRAEEPAAGNPLAVHEVAALDQRAVADVDHGARTRLVRGQEVGEHTIARAVVLRERAQRERARELVGGPGVDDVEVVDTSTGVRAAEVDALILQLLRELAVRLPRDLAADLPRVALER